MRRQCLGFVSRLADQPGSAASAPPRAQTMPPKRWATGAAAATRLLAPAWSWSREYGGRNTQAGCRRRHPITVTGTCTLPVAPMSQCRPRVSESPSLY